MNRIVQCGLVAGLLIFGAMSMGGAADENVPTVSEDYKAGYGAGYQDGFYEGAQLYGSAMANGPYLLSYYQDYMALSDEDKDKSQDFVSYYNNQSADFNQLVSYVNDRIVQIFGDDENVTSALTLTELPSI